jgi:hypothetical protein
MTKEQIETLRAWSHTIKSEKAEIETVLLQRILEDCLQFVGSEHALNVF